MHEILSGDVVAARVRWRIEQRARRHMQPRAWALQYTSIAATAPHFCRDCTPFAPRVKLLGAQRQQENPPFGGLS